MGQVHNSTASTGVEAHTPPQAGKAPGQPPRSLQGRPSPLPASSPCQAVPGIRKDCATPLFLPPPQPFFPGEQCKRFVASFPRTMGNSPAPAIPRDTTLDIPQRLSVLACLCSRLRERKTQILPPAGALPGTLTPTLHRHTYCFTSVELHQAFSVPCL